MFQVGDNVITMRSLTISLRSVACLFAFMLLIKNVHAQDEKKTIEKHEAAAIQSAITNHQFYFLAQYVLPIGGQQKYLTPGYDMRISHDSLSAYLPYFGRAYAAPIDPSDGGINFTSTKFNYKMENRKKGGWNISITPKDARDVRQLYLSVFEDGTATLQVISNNKQTISYTGYIKSKA